MSEQLKLQPLGAGVEIYTSSIHKFGTDAILLSHFADPSPKDVACDLGTGCGIIPLLWCREPHRPKVITAIDIQPDAIDLLNRSLKHNGIADFSPLCCDLRQTPTELHGSFTLVTMNPPYKRLEDGLISPNRGRAIARHELTCKVEDMAQCAAKLLKPSGRLCVCHRPERLSDLMCALRQFGIEPKRLQLVCQREGTPPMLVLCEGVRGGKSGLTVMPTLTVEDESGGYSPKMKEIYSFMESL